MTPPKTMTATTRFIFTLWLSLTAVWLIAAPTSAHSELREAKPEPGAQLTESPPEIRLTFNETIRANASDITLFANNFQTMTGITTQPNPNDPTQLIATLPPLSPGTYTVQWTAVSADGHPITGSYTFQILTRRIPRPQLIIGAVTLLFATLIFWRYRASPSL